MKISSYLNENAVELNDNFDFETYLKIYLSGCINKDGREKEAIISLIISGFYFNSWTKEYQLSFATDKISYDRLDFADKYYYDRSFHNIPDEYLSKSVFEACLEKMYQKYHKLFHDMNHTTESIYTQETHIYCDSNSNDIEKR